MRANNELRQPARTEGVYFVERKRKDEKIEML